MKKWNFYTANEIKPEGWLKRQLEIQANGLNGNLDKVWRDVRDSAWIGGDAEGWERVPYWLDGFIPLAYLLDNEDLKNRSRKYIDAIISRQMPDGWICPCETDNRSEYDSWATLLIAKVLVVYYECSNDERIPRVLYKALKNYYELLKSGEIELFEWGKYRWYEGFTAISFLKSIYHEPWIDDLAAILKNQGVDYKKLVKLWERPLNSWKLDTHIVNVVMALKYEAVSCDILNQNYKDEAEELYGVLKKYNGTPVGLFTGDECLSGLSPIQGSELCSVVEQMYSYELLYAYTGDNKWAERLELIAFNALPAALSDDMWSHQYDQMSNQIECTKFPGKPIFRTNNEEAHLFGLEPNFGCCTANFGQGWPKFLLSAFMHSGDEIINSIAVASSLTCPKADIKLETDYPFKNEFKYTITAKENFVFKIRIPSFAKNIHLNGKKTSENELTFKYKKGSETVLVLSYETEPYFEKRPHNLNTVRCGSVVFSVPVKYKKKKVEYEKNGVERKFPYCDYEYIPVSDWNYAYVGNEIKLEHAPIDKIPFSSDNPPLYAKTAANKINWGYEDGYESVCAKIPESNYPLGKEKEILLVPYGCAKLRMTELPFVNKD